MDLKTKLDLATSNGRCGENDVISFIVFSIVLKYEYTEVRGGLMFLVVKFNSPLVAPIAIPFPLEMSLVLLYLRKLGFYQMTKF